MTFIDLHTHKAYLENDILFIKNVIAGKEPVPDNCFFSIGVHPWYFNDKALNQVNKFSKSKNCLAIGECGLDLMPQILDIFSLEEQIEVFKNHMQISESIKKPLIIHCVKCFDKILQIKKQYHPQMPWIIHSFNKNTKLASQLIDAGFYLSFGVSIFYNKNSIESLKNIPLKRVFLETDDRTDYDIKKIYSRAAGIFQLNIEDLTNRITENFNIVFNSAK